ncbi:cellulase family glycosylhydrolase [uncultured Kordia sp.]|uniref:glycoside hydrolase family 5 protein n=1 Tax=uncultured Kordia sp. TaxID=507699 RepID=UPI00261F17BE|nr:cellulase family glycosylhydrolase [uncultured Kordia sp.]
MRFIFYIFVFCLTLPVCVFAQATPQQMVASMGRGINLGNVLSAPYEGNWAPAVEESYFDDTAAVGFKTVRIPIRFDKQTTTLASVAYTDAITGNYIGSDTDYSVNTSYLDRIEEVVDWALSKGLVAIIDVHGDHWFWESYDASSSHYKTGNDRLAAEDRFRAIWRDISVRFQNKSENLLFEIMNEAYFSMSATEVDVVNADILSIIRTTNSTRNVIVNGGGLNSWEAPLQMSSTFLNSDNYLIATFHYYKPFSFTSSSKPQHNNFSWGTTADKNSVDTHFDNVLTWSQTNNIPVLLGEFGADNEGGYNYFNQTYGTDGGPDNASRVAYHEYVAEAAINRGFAFTVWDAGEKSNKTIYKVTNRNWVTDVRNAVLGIDCLTSGIIANADVECGFNNDWSIWTQTAVTASLTNAEAAQSYNSSTSLKVDVTNAGSGFGQAVLRNQVVSDASLAGKTFTFSCKAKASTNTQQFKIRLKATVNGASQLTTSNTFDLSSTAYGIHNYTYTVPANTTALQFQVLVGKDTGNYFFDDFQVQEVESQVLSIQHIDNQNTLIIYPNPARDYLHIQTTKQLLNLELYTIEGEKLITTRTTSFSIKNYSNGLYILKATFIDNSSQCQKILIKK